MGGFPTIHHNEIVRVCDVYVEPPLQLLSGEFLSYSTANREDAACLDVRACGFWGLQQQSAFLDAQVFNPICTHPDVFMS